MNGILNRIAKTQISKNMLITISLIFFLIGTNFLTYRSAAYTAYCRCDGRYGKLVESLENSPDFKAYLTNNLDIYKRLKMFRPSGYMYQGFNRLLFYWAAGVCFIIAGMITLLATFFDKIKQTTKRVVVRFHQKRPIS
jgi:hypothetical protein